MLLSVIGKVTVTPLKWEEEEVKPIVKQCCERRVTVARLPFIGMVGRNRCFMPCTVVPAGGERLSGANK